MHAARVFLWPITTAILLGAVAEPGLAQPKSKRSAPIEEIIEILPPDVRSLIPEPQPRYETTFEFTRDLETTLDMLRRFAAPRQTAKGGTTPGANTTGRTLSDEEFEQFSARIKAIKDQWDEYQQARGTTPGTTPHAGDKGFDLSIPEPVDPDEDWSDWFKEFMDRVDESSWGDILKESSAWQRSMDDVKRWIEAGRFRDSSQEWQRWAKRWPRPDWITNVEWPEFQLPELPAGRLPGMPRVRMPRFGGGPSFGGGSVSANVQTLGWLLVAAALAGAAWLGWQELGRNKVRSRTRAGHIAWPVMPDKVTTREELIQAWDYLALHYFGESARTWNHRAVAARLAEFDSHPRLHPGARLCAPVVERLALQYELARYTPGPEDLSDEVRATAQQDLAFLAELAQP